MPTISWDKHKKKSPTYTLLLKYWVYSIVSQRAQGKYKVGVNLLYEKFGNEKSPNLGVMRAAGHTAVFLHCSSFKECRGNYVY